jgi:flagellar motor protein MotB
VAFLRRYAALAPAPLEDSSGRGEFEPLASNESEAGRQANRRIEVAIYSRA